MERWDQHYLILFQIEKKLRPNNINFVIKLIWKYPSSVLFWVLCPSYLNYEKADSVWTGNDVLFPPISMVFPCTCTRYYSLRSKKFFFFTKKLINNKINSTNDHAYTWVSLSSCIYIYLSKYKKFFWEDIKHNFTTIE